MEEASKAETVHALRACLKYIRQDVAEEGLTECLSHLDKAISSLDFIIAKAELRGIWPSEDGK